MTDLTPVGLSKDGTTLVLVSARGAEFRVRVDHRLRAALQGDHARAGQLEMKMESTLRPRDIQARIRAGESVEDVAAAAQTTVERIMIFAGPVLAERAHVAGTAQGSSVRRRNGEASPAGRTLEASALAHLRTVGLHEEDVSWDAWRRDDGRWVLVADFVAEGAAQHAEFVYDLPGRYVTAENDAARLLTGEATASPTASGAEQPARGSRRLAAVPSQDELPLGDDAIELVREPEQGSGHRPEQHDDHEPTVEVTTGIEPPREPESAEASAEPEKPAAKRKGRSSVPSWDEIMFGGGRTE